ncbi:nuclear ribonucleoprotein A1-like [Octopus vulgaris]|uniref:Nuclear ribonucleoprotein A1-like n=2 Tax=Octopus TaxID=6643 RepID=A0AA36B2Z3_OCTVU|nr:heterogeneous nuclear ribonucleoprotein A1-like [Octopus sinensis]CAI9726191.1 nuclear ribonucleoprotein A1-like [Octopus vulgaris]
MADRRFVAMDDRDYCKLFVGRLNRDINEKHLKSYFENWGEVAEARIVRDSYGFVTFRYPQHLDDCQGARPHSIGEQQIITRRVNSRDKNTAEVYKLFIKGVSEDTTETDIKQSFSPYGIIKDIEMPKDLRTGQQKDFCFVTFDDYDSVDKCVIQQTFSVAGRDVWVQKDRKQDLQGRSVTYRKGGYEDGYSNSSNYRRDQGWHNGGISNGGNNNNYNGGGHNSSNYSGDSAWRNGNSYSRSNYRRENNWNGRSSYHQRDDGFTNRLNFNRDPNWSNSHTSSYHDQQRSGGHTNTNYHRERSLGRVSSSYGNNKDQTRSSKRNYDKQGRN